jgi:hypothetical protein
MFSREDSGALAKEPSMKLDVNDAGRLRTVSAGVLLLAVQVLMGTLGLVAKTSRELQALLAVLIIAGFVAGMVFVLSGTGHQRPGCGALATRVVLSAFAYFVGSLIFRGISAAMPLKMGAVVGGLVYLVAAVAVTFYGGRGLSPTSTVPQKRLAILALGGMALTTGALALVFILYAGTVSTVAPAILLAAGRWTLASAVTAIVLVWPGEERVEP